MFGEMMEERNEPTITTTKRIKFEEEDKISSLPDCLLVEILSRLPDTKYAIRTGALAKRWQHIWTGVHNLIFNRSYKSSTFDDPTPFFSFVDKALTQRGQFNINKFEVELYYGYDTQFESQFHNWFHYAITCNVKELNMQLLNRDVESQFVLSEDFIFITNSSFTHLSLGGCLFNFFGPVSWTKLKSLSISHGNLDEDMIENILSGCPLLETLTLSNCYGYRRLDITSKSVKNLVFSGYASPTPDHGLDGDHRFDGLLGTIEINAPNILSLTIEDQLLVWKMSLLNVSSLVKADLNYIKLGYYETTRKEAKEEMLKGFILSLGHVNELKIGNCCYGTLSRLKAKGFTFPPNLKTYSLMDGCSAVVS